MVAFFVRLLLNALGLLLVAEMIPGVYLGGWLSALKVALALSLVNTFIKPILTIITLPLSILTLGIFYLVLNVLIIWGVDAVLSDFAAPGFWAAFFFGLGNSVLNSILDSFSDKD